MFDLISPEEQDKIIDYITVFGPLDGEINNDKMMAPLPLILGTWSVEKQTLFKLLGNQLIVRRPYTYTMPNDNLINEIIDDRFNPFYSGFKNWWASEIVCGFAEKYPELYWLAKDLISPKMLAENRYYHDTQTFIFPDGEQYKVSKGMRPIRIITKIAQKYNCDPQLLENFRLWHSRILNQKYMDGELCLSIHPLDYMTMSDNDNNWDSCMKWNGVGDYRCGTVECMNAPNVLIAYLHNPDHPMSPFTFKDWKWNSKKWRELFIVNEEVISEVKGYCFQDESLTNTILMWIKELAEKNLGWTYDNDEINIQDTISWENDADMCFRFYPGKYMYNDIGTLEKHRARINRQKLGKYNLIEWKTPSSDKTHFMAEISFEGQATCMWCGQPITEDGRENAVMCTQCDNGRYCAICGSFIYGDEYTYIDEVEGPICFTCYDDECSYDDLTGEKHLINNLTSIYWCMGYDEDHHPIFYKDKYNYSFYCYDPEFNYIYKQVFSCTPHRYKDGYIVYDYITLDDVKNMDAFMDVFHLSVAPEEIMVEEGILT